MSSEIKIRWAKREDMGGLQKMIKDLAIDEKMPDGPEIGKDVLEKDCFDTEPPLYKCYVVEDYIDGVPSLIGYAIFFIVYSTWKGKALMLEDIYIHSDYRKRGLGKKVLSTLSKYALENNCSYINFNVLDWNPARFFYDACGAVNISESENRIRLRLTKSQLETF